MEISLQLNDTESILVGMKGARELPTQTVAYVHLYPDGNFDKKIPDIVEASNTGQLDEIDGTSRKDIYFYSRMSLPS